MPDKDDSVFGDPIMDMLILFGDKRQDKGPDDGSGGSGNGCLVILIVVLVLICVSMLCAMTK